MLISRPQIGSLTSEATAEGIKCLDCEHGSDLDKITKESFLKN